MTEKVIEPDNGEPIVEVAAGPQSGVAVGEAAAGVESSEAAPTLDEQLAALRAEVEDYKDRWLRSRAEFDNARKRMERQRQEAYGMALADVVGPLFPVLDDFGRAMTTVPPAIAADDWFQGIILVQRKLAGILEAFHIEPIKAVGEPFDPTVHEAVLREDSEQYGPDIVTKELQTGYRRGDTVLRPALVAVAN